MIFRAILLVLASSMTIATAAAQGGGWRPYNQPDLGYSIDLPDGFFESVEENDLGLVMDDEDYEVRLEVYGSPNLQGLSTSELMAAVEQADRIRDVTYRKRGNSWFVLSGYYQRDGHEADDLIFYAKFMFNADRTAFSAFEISYPVAYKRDLDQMVSDLEDSLRAPL